MICTVIRLIGEGKLSVSLGVFIEHILRHNQSDKQLTSYLDHQLPGSQITISNLEATSEDLVNFRKGM